MFASWTVAVLVVSSTPLSEEEKARVASDTVLLAGAKITPDGPGLLKYLCERGGGVKSQAKVIEAMVARLGARRFTERERATNDLTAAGPAALPFVKKVLAHQDAEVRRRAAALVAILDRRNSPEVEQAALRMVRLLKPEGAAAAVLAFLPAARDVGGEQDALATLAAVCMKAGKLDAAVLEAMSARESAARGGAALVVAYLGNDAQKEQVRDLLKTERDPLVRLRAAQGLLAARDKTAVPVLLALLADSPASIGVQAGDSLKALAGDRAPRQEYDEAKDRKQCQAAWQAWWKGNEAKLDLAKGEIGLPWACSEVRAREAVTSFMHAMLEQSAGQFYKSVAYPFVLDEVLTCKDRKTFEQVTKPAFERPRTPEQATTIVRMRVVKANCQALKDRRSVAAQLKSHGETNVWAVYVTGKTASSPSEETSIILVRVCGGQGHVIGLLMKEPLKKQ